MNKTDASSSENDGSKGNCSEDSISTSNEQVSRPITKSLEEKDVGKIGISIPKGVQSTGYHSNQHNEPRYQPRGVGPNPLAFPNRDHFYPPAGIPSIQGTSTYPQQTMPTLYHPPPQTGYDYTFQHSHWPNRWTPPQNQDLTSRPKSDKNVRIRYRNEGEWKQPPPMSSFTAKSSGEDQTSRRHHLSLQEKVPFDFEGTDLSCSIQDPSSIPFRRATESFSSPNSLENSEIHPSTSISTTDELSRSISYSSSKAEGYIEGDQNKSEKRKRQRRQRNKGATPNERRLRKNELTRVRAAKVKQEVELLKLKNPAEITDEERRRIQNFEERRHRKNIKTRKRALEKKNEVARIQAIPEHERSTEQQTYLDRAIMSRLRKNEGDRLRRERIKKLASKSSHASINDSSVASGYETQSENETSISLSNSRVSFDLKEKSAIDTQNSIMKRHPSIDVKPITLDETKKLVNKTIASLSKSFCGKNKEDVIEKSQSPQQTKYSHQNEKNARKMFDKAFIPVKAEDNKTSVTSPSNHEPSLFVDTSRKPELRKRDYSKANNQNSAHVQDTIDHESNMLSMFQNNMKRREDVLLPNQNQTHLYTDMTSNFNIPPSIFDSPIYPSEQDGLDSPFHEQSFNRLSANTNDFTGNSNVNPPTFAHSGIDSGVIGAFDSKFQTQHEVSHPSHDEVNSNLSKLPVHNIHPSIFDSPIYQIEQEGSDILHQQNMNTNTNEHIASHYEVISSDNTSFRPKLGNINDQQNYLPPLAPRVLENTVGHSVGSSSRGWQRTMEPSLPRFIRPGPQIMSMPIPHSPIQTPDYFPSFHIENKGRNQPKNLESGRSKVTVDPKNEHQAVAKNNHE